MIRLRASLASVFALALAAIPAIAHAQATLPTSAYSMNGVAGTLADREESALTGRLRTLRNADMLTTTRPHASTTSRQPAIMPMQDDEDTLNDLRTEKKVPNLTNAHGTQYQQRLTAPALYKNSPTDTYSHTPTLAERTYDKAMDLSARGAGEPNLAVRGTDAPKVRNVPNLAERTYNKAIDFAGDLGGQGRTFETTKSGLPRYTSVTMRDKDSMAASHYRGQPLGNLSNSMSQKIAMPAARASYSDTPRPLAPQSLGQLPSPAPSAAPTKSLDPYNVAPPVIYGPNDPLPTAEIAAAPAAQVPSPAPMAAAETAPTATLPAFKYKKLDQSKGMTTPKIGSPSSLSSTVNVPQATNFAMASSPESTFNFKSGYVPPRAPTQAGTFLWSTDDSQNQMTPSLPSAMNDRKEVEAPLVAPASTNTTYGTKAVPLPAYGAGADRRWGFFVSGDTGFGADQHMASGNKTDSTPTGVTAGVDYRLKDKTFVGIALTYAHSSFTTGSTSDLQGNSFALSLYGTSDIANNVYADSYLSVGYHALDSERTPNASAQRAKASPDGFQVTSRTEIGYDMKQDDFKFGPYGAFRFSYVDYASYTESGAGNANLKVRGTDSVSAITTLGFGGARRFAMSNGGALLPGMRVSYNHEFGDTQTTVKSSFVNAPASILSTKTDKKSRDWIALAPSMTAALPNDWTLVAQYEHDFLRDDVNETIFNLAAQYKW